MYQESITSKRQLNQALKSKDDELNQLKKKYDKDINTAKKEKIKE